MSEYEDKFKKIVDGLNIDDKPSFAHREKLGKEIGSTFSSARDKTLHFQISTQPIRKTIMKNRITKLTAAAVIIIATSLFFIQQEQPRVVQTQQITKMEKSPAELLTMGALNLAHRHGGMKAVEEQSLKALRMVTVANSNIKQLQVEYFKNNGI